MFDRTFLGVDIGTYSIKLVEYQRGLRAGCFTRCAEASLPVKPSPEDVAAVLSHQLEEGEFARDCVITALSGSRVTQRHFRLPFVGKQVAGAVRFEVEESVPVPLERMILAHEPVTIRPGQTDVLAILAPRTEVEQHLSLVRGSALEPRHVEVEGAVIANLARYLGLGDAPRLFLDVGHAKTQICLVATGKPVLLRALPVAGQRFTEALAEELNLHYEDAEEYKHEHGVFKPGTTTPLSPSLAALLDQLVRECLRTLQSLVSDSVNPASPAEIILFGGSSAIAELPRYFAERMGIPCRALTVDASVEGSGPLAQPRAAVLATAAALALRGSNARGAQLDLRQDEFRYVPDLSALWPQVQWTGLWLGVLLVLWPLSLCSQLWGAHRQANALRAEISQLHEQVFSAPPSGDDPAASFRSKFTETKQLADHLGVTGSGASPLEMLRLISNSIPKQLDISLVDLRIEQKSIRARGFAPDASAANQVEQLLREIKIFKTVTVGDLTRQQGASGASPRFSFNLTINLDG